MNRFAMLELERWRSREGKKPLLIRGARQVGKTWLMREFGRTSYRDSLYVNFDGNRAMGELFSSDMDVRRILTGLELYSGKKIDPRHTLIIFDEVQEAPRALSSLKYFNEEAPEYQIICAGSLLGVALHGGESFPVGKVEFLDLYPMSFAEFMTATGNERYVQLLSNRDFEMARTFRQIYIDSLKYYYFVGGLPEVVESFALKRDFNEAREIQRGILDAYEQDFSKHAPHDAVPRVRMLWNSVPSQLARENKKFIYGLVREGARAREYEEAMLWLTDCGLLHKVHRVTRPSVPLGAYEDLKAFKLFLLDVGLLSCLARLGQDALLDGASAFREFKGALTEQYVLQQLMTIKNLGAYYWTNDRGGAEVDFVVSDGNAVVPVEAKAEVNLKAKSLASYREKFNPALSVRTSMADYSDEGLLLNLPLYAIEFLGAIISDKRVTNL